jgi:uncharacterized protein (DUF1330 family)
MRFVEGSGSAGKQSTGFGFILAPRLNRRSTGLEDMLMSAYFIFVHKVLDSDKLNNDYLPKAVESLQPYNPEILVVDQDIEVIEGDSEDSRVVVLKFKDREEAKRWYNSPEYQSIVNLRLDSIEGRAVLCDGLEPADA